MIDRACQDGYNRANYLRAAFLFKESIIMQIPEQKLLFAKLQDLGINVQTYTHQPVFTCQEAELIKGQLPEHAGIKNLFLKDKKGHYWLVVACDATQIQLKKLAKFLNAGNLSFANPDDLFAHLKVLPGSVTPLALMHDEQHAVQVIVDQAIFGHGLIGVHPLINSATVLIAPQDVQKFIESCGNRVQYVDFSLFLEDSL